MKKVRTIKISIMTKEILVANSEQREMAMETELPLCPKCHSRIAEAVNSAMETLSETELKETLEIRKEINE